MRRWGRVYFDELEERNLLAFAPSVPYSTGSAPHHLVSSDFNSDGNPDLAVAASGSDQISILMGLGNGTFQAGTPLTVNDEPFHVEAADFNADGKIDLAVPNYGSDLLSVMLGNGNGTFQARVDYAAGSFPTAVDSGDLNGDGKLDLVVVNNLGQSARVMLGNGNGTFQAGVSYGIHQSFGVALGDFNSDGKLDVAASGYVAGVVSVLLGNGNGTLQPRIDYTVGPNPYNVALADFDRDGDLDIATPAYGANYVSVLKGAGNGTFPQRVDVPTGTHPLGVTTADYNMDGKLDLAVALAEPNPDTTYSVGVLHGNGNGSFQSQTLYNVGTNPFAITSGDFNRDGAADLAAANELSANASVLLNTDPVTNSSIASSVWSDLDSDGIQDAGEPGMSGVVVELFNSADGIIGNGNDLSLGTQTTDASGNYSFANVTAGSYYLRFRKPSGYIFSPRDAGDDALDSDANYHGFTEVFTLAAGQNDSSRDAGLRSAADRIVFASNRDGDFDIWEMDTSGANVLQLLNVAGTDNNGSWSPNGDKLLFSSDRDGDPEIYVMNADGSGVTKLTNNTSLDSGPVWSPDGSKIAFVSQRDGNYEIYVMNADGTNQTRLTTNAAQDLAPDWSPDGSRLVFYSDRTGGGDIYVVSATGGTPTRLTTSTASDTTPHFSPDGTKIAFDSARDGDDEIWVMNADGSSQTQLTFNTQFDQGPRWSPDGSKLVFYRDFGVNREVFVMNANGSSETNISNHTAADDNPTWSQKAVGSLGNFVWNDLDGDGIQDAGEPGMPGVTVSVYTQAVGGTTVATTTTNGSGLYTFNALAAQTYYLEVSLPSGYYVSPQDQGNDDALDSDINPGSRRTGPVVLSAQQSIASIDAGLSQAALQVVSLTSTATGFIAHFNRELDPSQLNLYDEGGVVGPSDLTLTGNSTGSVRGSAVVDPGLRRITFIATNGTLPPDTYSVVLKSGANAIKDSQGGLLDGNRDGTTGDDYLGNLTLGNPTPGAITLTAPNVTRGYGQPVNLPASASSGLPIAISNAQGVKSASFTLHYNPALLSITGAAAGPGISGNVTLDTSMPGMAIVTITSATQLSATSGSKTLVQLTASVPSDAPYGSKQILDLANIHLFDTSPVPVELPSIDDDGVHIAAFFGDANGSQSYNAPDATAVQRLIVGTNSGLSAYQLADPHLIVDISGNSQVQSDDVTQIQRAIVGSSTADIPPLPGLPSVSPGGADPLLYIPQDLVATQVETLTVPVNLLVTEPTGISLAGADVAIAYDAAVLQLDRVSAGALMIGFGLNLNAATPGVIRLSLGGGAPLSLPHDSSGILAQLQFTVIAGADSSALLNLLAANDQLQTALYDDLGRALTLVPAPTNDDDDAVDGRLRIRPASLSDQGAAVDQAFAGEREWRNPEDF